MYATRPSRDQAALPRGNPRIGGPPASGTSIGLPVLSPVET